jgi:hypothetical protein
MTIAALRALLDQELPDVPRHPAPRLNLPRWTAKKKPIDEPPPTADEWVTDLQLSELLAWSRDHDDPAVQAMGDQASHVVAALHDRRSRDAELARIEKELADVDARAEQLRARRAELAPAPPKKRHGTVDYPAAEVRTWARTAGLDCPSTGRVPAAVVQAWRDRPQEG